MSMSAKDIRMLTAIFEKSGGSPWEPKDYRHPFILSAIDAGYLKRVDGRFGFERFKDSLLTFTDAGRLAIERAK